MNYSQLRVGNYLLACGEIAKLLAIDTSNHTIDIAAISTPEILKTVCVSEAGYITLIKDLLTQCCGFTDIHYGCILHAGKYELLYREHARNELILMHEASRPLIYFWDIKSLHQLQNLYHQFKGGELEINSALIGAPGMTERS